MAAPLPKVDAKKFGTLLDALWLRHEFEVPVIPPPVEWIESSVDLGNDPTSAGDGLVKLDKYQVEPINAQFQDGVHEVVVMGPPQTGKSFCWRLPLLYKMRFINGPRWIIYESDDKAEDINAQQMDPLIRAVPELVQRLADAGRHSSVRRQYRFPTGPVDFSGAGSEPTSKPERDGVADELDTWPITDSAKRKTLASFRDRFATWWAKGQGCLVIVSSPNGQNSMVGREWKSGSRGEFWLRCQGCGGHTLNSNRVDNLQWECDNDDQPIAESIRLICPDCKHEHTEDQAPAMCDAGEYKHQRPERKKKSFQWGALASPRTRSWLWIAEQQMNAGSKATLDELENYWKVVRGLPYRRRSINHDALAVIRQHEGPLPDPDSLCLSLFSADTQDNGWWWIVRAIDKDRNTYKLAHGFANNEDELAAAWDDKYLGRQCVMGIVDEGGHRGTEVVSFVRDRIGLYTYKGNSRIMRWAYQKGDKLKKRINANPKHYQAELLYYIHVQGQREGGNYWYCQHDEDPRYVEQLASVQPDNKVKNGDLLENWTNADRPDHLFDCEKQWRALLTVAEEELRPNQWYSPPPWLYSEKQAARRRPKINIGD